VDVELRGDVLEVYYNRELRARYNFATGKELPLDELPAPPLSRTGAQASRES
jgi:hypothetical protein